MHSISSYSNEAPCPDQFGPGKVEPNRDHFSQAVLSFMYEAGLLIVSGDDNIVTVVPDCALASKQEVIAYDEPCENASAVHALNQLQEDGFAECDSDDEGRRVYRLSFRGRQAVDNSSADS